MAQTCTNNCYPELVKRASDPGVTTLYDGLLPVAIIPKARETNSLGTETIQPLCSSTLVNMDKNMIKQFFFVFLYSTCMVFTTFRVPKNINPKTFCGRDGC